MEIDWIKTLVGVVHVIWVSLGGGWANIDEDVAVLGAEDQIAMSENGGGFQPLRPDEVRQVLAGVEYRYQLDWQPHHPVAGVVPHHLLAGHMISGLVQSLPANKTIILVSPDHFHTHSPTIITRRNDLATVFGPVGVEGDIVDRLIESGLASEEVTGWEREHGINAVTPFIKYFLPETRLVPLVIKNSISYEQLMELAEAVFEACGFDRCLVLASTDFSHDLKVEEAAINDTYTWELIEQRNLRGIFSLNNQYTDSPPGLILALEFAKKHGVTRTSVIERANSAEMAGQRAAATTTYFSLLMH